MCVGFSLCHLGRVPGGSHFRYSLIPSRPLSERAAVLILTRKSNESIVVGDHVRVVVVEIKGRQVRLGVEAPEDMKIYRGEIFDRIQAENSRASRVGTAELNSAARLWGRVRSEGAPDAD